jgi:hypothetical protein
MEKQKTITAAYRFSASRPQAGGSAVRTRVLPHLKKVLIGFNQNLFGYTVFTIRYTNNTTQRLLKKNN